MKPQTIFNKVVRHLAEQGRPSLDAYGDCAYRGESGAKCAVGALIPDRCYDAAMEGSDVYMLCDSEYATLLPAHFKNNKVLLFALQGAHDNAPFTKAMTFKKRQLSARLAAIANEFSLDPSVIVECFPGHRPGAGS